jgi:hypothetical protein
MHAEALRLRVSAVVIAAERCALRGAPPIGSECVARLSRVEGGPVDVDIVQRSDR